MGADKQEKKQSQELQTRDQAEATGSLNDRDEIPTYAGLSGTPLYVALSFG